MKMYLMACAIALVSSGCAVSTATSENEKALAVPTALIMPDVVGQHYDAAARQIKAHYSNARIQVLRNYSDAPFGTVFRTKPAAGEDITSFENYVRLYTSKGPEPKSVFVPDVIGSKYSVAVHELGKLGIPYVLASGSLDQGEKRLTNCERHIWYPVVAKTTPPVGTEWRPGRTPLRIDVETHEEFPLNSPPRGEICD